MKGIRTGPGRPPGGKKYGGRAKGTPNRANKNAKAAIAKFIDGRCHEFEGWFNEILKEDKVEAVKIWLALLEYHLPKLARTEMTGADGKELAPTKIVIVPGQCQPQSEKSVLSSRRN